MTRKKNKLLVLCCSLIPGCGEMYLGFLKQGISIMALFFLLSSIPAALNMPILMIFTPVIWFYSFFHVHNLSGMPDDEFYALEDDYLISFQSTASISYLLMTKYRRPFAVVLLFLGASIIWNALNDFVFHFLLRYFHLPKFVTELLSYVGRTLPQAIVGLLIIFVGFTLIKRKKEELDRID